MGWGRTTFIRSVIGGACFVAQTMIRLAIGFWGVVEGVENFAEGIRVGVVDMTSMSCLVFLIFFFGFFCFGFLNLRLGGIWSVYPVTAVREISRGHQKPSKIQVPQAQRV